MKMLYKITENHFQIYTGKREDEGKERLTTNLSSGPQYGAKLLLMLKVPTLSIADGCQDPQCRKEAQISPHSLTILYDPP